MPAEFLEKMTEEQKKDYENEQIMRGMGNKCLKKACESLCFSAVMMVVLYQTGLLEQYLLYLNPHLAQPAKAVTDSFSEL